MGAGKSCRLRHFQGYRTLVASRRVAAPCWPRRLDIPASVYSNPENALMGFAGGYELVGDIDARFIAGHQPIQQLSEAISRGAV